MICFVAQAACGLRQCFSSQILCTRVHILITVAFSRPDVNIVILFSKGGKDAGSLAIYCPASRSSLPNSPADRQALLETLAGRPPVRLALLGRK
jgi:hypothetical protein